jgi:hypothetical protein
MRLIILFVILIMLVNNVIAQNPPIIPKPTKEQLEQQKKLHERFLQEEEKRKEKESKKSNINMGARWSGTIKSEEIVNYTNPSFKGKAERVMVATFKETLPTLYRDEVENTELNFIDDKGTGTHSFHSETSLITLKGCSHCDVNGQAELHSVIIREWDSTYDIEAIPPACTGTNCDGTTYGPATESITVSNRHLLDKDVLSGTVTTTGELIGGYGDFTKTITWHFTRVKEDDVELIVTPVDYDKWLPVPGKDELTRGGVMTVNLKLQGKNGKPLKAKAETFELRLNNTSIEPGITINYPVQPDPKQLPDLRFLLHPSIESLDPDQFVSINSPDGISGKAMIASYDGGGWSILTAEAILKDGRKIQGRLLKPGGEIDIRIPKRDPNSHIGEAWLKDNKNPGETDDKETSTGNNNPGDGLSAYEEYRGIISKAYQLYSGGKKEFSRLSPKKKELGVIINKQGFDLFKEGFKWFENASDVAIIPFDENAIDIDKRLNKNVKTANIYHQFAVKITTGKLSGALGKTYPDTDIPENIQKIVIDYNICMEEYGYWQDYSKEIGMKIPYTEKELIAKTVAHEIGHAVAIMHHGSSHKTTNGPDAQKTFDDAGAKYLIISTQGMPISLPYKITGLVGGQGNEESGDLSCTMVYQPYCKWALGIKNGLPCFTGTRIYPLGNTMCDSPDGKFINQKDGQHDNDYFGDALFGNCLSRIKLKK